MAVEEELKRDHAEMQAVIDAKQKIIDAQVTTQRDRTLQQICAYLTWEGLRGCVCVSIFEQAHSLG